MSVRWASPALATALLFGASTPSAKLLVGSVSPLLLAELLGLGSGFGLGMLRVLRRLRGPEAARQMHVPGGEIPWLLGAILFGVISLALWPAPASALLWAAAAMMGFGVWLHVRERHRREHTHEPLENTHQRRHDERQRHGHDFE